MINEKYITVTSSYYRVQNNKERITKIMARIQNETLQYKHCVRDNKKTEALKHIQNISVFNNQLHFVILDLRRELLSLIDLEGENNDNNLL